MTRHFAPLVATALGLNLVAGAAAADLTAADVWEDWRGYMQGMGYVIEAQETMTDDTLSVSDITVNLRGGEDIETMQITLGQLDFVENDDGTVEVVMPDSLPIAVAVDATGTDDPTNMIITYSQSGQRMMASGTPEALTYDYTADTFGIALSGLVVEGEAMDTAFQASMAGANLRSKTDVTVSDIRTYAQDFSTDDLTYEIFFQEPDEIEAFDLSFAAQQIGFVGTTSLPVDDVPSATDMNALLEAGFAFDGAFTTQTSETEVEVTSPDGTSRIKTASVEGAYRIAMGTDGLRYDLGAKDTLVGAQIAGLPIPLSAQMAEAGVDIATPVMKSEEPQDFAMAFNLTDFSMSDVIWGMFDPSAQLPREPATIALDLTGKAKMLFDVLDPAAAAQGAETPGELNALKINDLIIDAVGARLDATGDLTFDNTDMATLPGFPNPVGEVNIDLAGANALLDKLVTIGLLPQDQAMGARMMMGLFAVPGDGEDTLKSKIEFKEAGQILANGQRLK